MFTLDAVLMFIFVTHKISVKLWEEFDALGAMLHSTCVSVQLKWSGVSYDIVPKFFLNLLWKLVICEVWCFTSPPRCFFLWRWALFSCSECCKKFCFSADVTVMFCKIHTEEISGAQNFKGRFLSIKVSKATPIATWSCTPSEMIDEIHRLFKVSPPRGDFEHLRF